MLFDNLVEFSYYIHVQQIICLQCFVNEYMAFLILLTSTGSTWISTVVHLFVGS